MKILFVQNRLLFPADTGGKIRTLNILRHLAEWHDVTYACPAQSGEAAAVEQMRALGLSVETVPSAAPASRRSIRFGAQMVANLGSPRPLSVDRTYNHRLRRLVRNLLDANQFDLVICDFVQSARHVLGLDAATLLFQHNVEAQILQRHAATSAGVLRRHYLAMQARRMRRFEARAGREFDLVVSVSEPDAEIFKQDYGWMNVTSIDTGVDLDYFRLNLGDSEQAGRVLFLGSMDWMPNQEGVDWFVRHVWPAVRREEPSAVFQVVGRRPSGAIQKLAAFDGVEIVGTVPDVRPYLGAASVVVVPLLVGGGTRLKIFEAMAMAKAVVSTAIGAEGLPVTPGEHFLLADDPQRFADSVIELLRSPARRDALRHAARELVATRFGSEAVARQFERACVTAAAHGRERRAGAATTAAGPLAAGATL